MNRRNIGTLAIGLLMSSLTVSAADPYSSIIAHQQGGRYNEALSQISGLLDTNQNDIQALLLKGNVNKLMGNTTEAVDIFKRLINQHPQMPEAYNNLGVLYADKGQTALAIETLQQVFSTSDSYGAAHKNLRNLYNQMASSAYREALDIDKEPAKVANQYTLLNKPQLVADTNTTTVAFTADGVIVDTGAISDEVSDKNISSEVSAMIDNWAQTWSQRKFRAYFKHYDQSFVPPNGAKRKTWERVCGTRLNKPKFIEIDIVGLSVQQKSAITATAMFEQHYRSNTYIDTVVKMLTLKKLKGKWLIVKESVL
jgi:tetratricopeptide (TPR) repeat protein